VCSSSSSSSNSGICEVVYERNVRPTAVIEAAVLHCGDNAAVAAVLPHRATSTDSMLCMKQLVRSSSSVEQPVLLAALCVETHGTAHMNIRYTLKQTDTVKLAAHSAVRI
jgi:hypothetical protein